jgi:hypothetical protein
MRWVKALAHLGVSAGRTIRRRDDLRIRVGWKFAGGRVDGPDLGDGLDTFLN